MSRITGYSLPLLLVALVVSAPMARADADSDTETLSLYASKMADACPAVALSMLDEELQSLVPDRAAFVANVCQCVVSAVVDDERTHRLLTVHPAVRNQLLASERNQRYLKSKAITASLRCTASALDSVLSNYSMDDGSPPADTPTAKPQPE